MKTFKCEQKYSSFKIYTKYFEKWRKKIKRKIYYCKWSNKKIIVHVISKILHENRNRIVNLLS